MTPQELRLALGALHWSQAELSRRLGVHVNTVTNWATDGVPGYVAEYLRVMALAAQIVGKK